MGYVLITGASSGIGKSIAYTFASKGYDLILAARRINVLEEIKTDITEKFGVKVEVFESDLSDGANAHKLYEDAKGFELSALINNAGFGNFNTIWDADISLMEQMIDLNVKSLSILSMLFAKDHKDKDAQLINVASVVGYLTMPAFATYSATKFYVSSYTEMIAKELKAAGAPMKAKILAPGPVETEFFDVATDASENEMDAEAFTFHSADQMAEFTWQLFESDDVVGIVNLADMTFATKDTIHPVLPM